MAAAASSPSPRSSRGRGAARPARRASSRKGVVERRRRATSPLAMSHGMNPQAAGMVEVGQGRRDAPEQLADRRAAPGCEIELAVVEGDPRQERLEPHPVRRARRARRRARAGRCGRPACAATGSCGADAFDVDERLGVAVDRRRRARWRWRSGARTRRRRRVVKRVLCERSPRSRLRVRRSRRRGRRRSAGRRRPAGPADRSGRGPCRARCSTSRSRPTATRSRPVGKPGAAR